MQKYNERWSAAWRAAGAACAALAMAACLEPKYIRPAMPAPQAYKEADAAPQSPGTWKTAVPGDALPRGQWWKLFGDARLNRLEEQVSESNNSLLQAQAQFRQSRALVSSSLTEFFPSVTANPSATRARSYSSGNNSYSYSNNYSLPGTASWEPDLWGQIRLTAKTAAANAQASAANLESTRLILQAELASDYFALETLDMQQALLSSATVDYESALQLTTNRFNAGVASQADVAQAQTQLYSAQAQLTDLGITRAQFEHAIAVLVGVSPSSFSLAAGQISGAPPPIPAGVPSQLLERRPDIAAAERQVAAANAGIGIARAAYFPIISLAVTGGFMNAAASQWLQWPSRFFSVGASAAQTLIDFGKRGALRKQAWATYDAAVAGYRQTVLGAFQEVEDNLSALRLLSQEVRQEDAAVKAADDSVRLTLERYVSGLISYLDVITAQNIALTNRNTAAQIQGRRMTAAITLIRSLGGGWNASQLPTGGGLRATFKSGSLLEAKPAK